MQINAFINTINGYVWGWPLISLVLTVGLLLTCILRFIQIRYFAYAWQLLFKPQEKIEQADMSPFQALINALSASIGNGSIAGIATAIAAGGPGAAFWIFIMGFLGMAIRFAEVFLATYFPPITYMGNIIGGPLVYLKKLPVGIVISYVYAVFLLFLGFFGSGLLQGNSITLGCVRIFGVQPWIIGVILFLFLAYVVGGGAKRIIQVSDSIVPIKVGTFFVSAIIVLIYHAKNIIPALHLIIEHAFYPKAIMGAGVGLLIQKAMRYGIDRTLNASEAGLGTAAVLFGGTEAKDPIKSGIMSMLSVFISANLVCFMIALIIIASGVWNNGQTSLDLTITAYETVFGHYGGWIVTFLSISFGIGVLVTYAYIARVCWLYLTSGRFEWLFSFLFCAIAFVGAVANVEVVWNSLALVNAGLLILNLGGILWLLPLIKRTFDKAQRENKI